MKKLIPLFVTIAAVLFFVSQVVPQNEEFKNLKVLKPAGKAEKMRIMAAYNKELGVKCEYCHDPKDYAKEENEQYHKARMMQTMVNEINAKFFNYKDAPQVSCVFCHGGNPKPKAAAKK
jgi:hypothetical protein